MKIDEVINKKSYFNSLEEAKEFRPSLWNNVSDIISKLKEDMFDYIHIDNNIFIMNEFFNRDIYKLEKVDLLIKLSREDLEVFMENKIIDDVDTSHLNIFIDLLKEEASYEYVDGFFKSTVIDCRNIKSV